MSTSVGSPAAGLLFGFEGVESTGVPRSQEPPPPQDPTVALCLGTYGDPRGVGVSYERGTPVLAALRSVSLLRADLPAVLWKLSEECQHIGVLVSG